MNIDKFEDLFSELTNFKKNHFHPLVWITGNPTIGKNVYIGGMSEIAAKNSNIIIEDNCDIASFVSINCGDSHKRCIGLDSKIKYDKIVLEKNVFVGSHSVIKAGAHIGHHSVIASGTVVDGIKIPPYSLVSGNPMKVKNEYYKKYDST